MAGLAIDTSRNLHDGVARAPTCGFEDGLSLLRLGLCGHLRLALCSCSNQEASSPAWLSFVALRSRDSASHAEGCHAFTGDC